MEERPSQLFTELNKPFRKESLKKFRLERTVISEVMGSNLVQA